MESVPDWRRSPGQFDALGRCIEPFGSAAVRAMVRALSNPVPLEAAPLQHRPELRAVRNIAMTETRPFDLPTTAPEGIVSPSCARPGVRRVLQAAVAVIALLGLADCRRNQDDSRGFPRSETLYVAGWQWRTLLVQPAAEQPGLADHDEPDL